MNRRHVVRLGLARHVAASVPLFFPALAAVAAGDLVATLPARLVARFATVFDLDFRDPPVSIRSFEVAAVRHRRDHRSPLHRWLIDIVRGPVAAAADEG